MAEYAGLSYYVPLLVFALLRLDLKFFAHVNRLDFINDNCHNQNLIYDERYSSDHALNQIVRLSY